MPDPIPACFRGGAAASPAGAAGPSLTTSVYETHIGLVAFSWSRTVLGLSLRAEIRLFSAEDNVGDCSDEDADEPLGFRIRPWVLWKRRGSKRFHLGNQSPHRCVDFAWDLSRARFSSGGSPEPTSGFFVSVAVDGQVALVAGDLCEEAYKKAKAQRATKPFTPKDPVLISRREHVVLGESCGRRSYKTTALFAGTEREISIDLAAREKDRGGEVGMWVGVDGKHVLHVRRLRWKFRGSEKVELEGGGRIQVSWDLHNWLFQPTADPAPEVAGHAVFVFRFEGKEGVEEDGRFGERWGSFGGCKGALGEYFGKRMGRNLSESSSGGGGERRSGRRRRKDLLKTSSSSSVSSTASSASGSTIMDWASPEEVEMQRGEGFSLLVYAWKS
ncbi:uncharacterized protein [Typha angustifolia]|uniref:uncharacterized protein n=1 Tax=Typha angustifolia TaxID=59011 RepID=UPI003C2C52F5